VTADAAERCNRLREEPQHAHIVSDVSSEGMRQPSRRLRQAVNVFLGDQVPGRKWLQWRTLALIA
jgi:hypothetical protein